MIIGLSPQVVRRLCATISLAFALLLSSLLILAMPARAHEVTPAIGDLEAHGNVLQLSIRLNLEGMLAGVDLSAYADTNDAPQADAYDRLRAMSPAELGAEGRRAWPMLAGQIAVNVDGERLVPELTGIGVEPIPGLDLPRFSTLHLQAPLPEGARVVEFRWAPGFGDIVLRQHGVDEPFTALIKGGDSSGPIALAGGGEAKGWQAFFGYIPVGYEHILPLGLDHILFVLGLFFLSTRLRPLIWQISAFTLAHTLTLALAALGYVAVPARIVEPLIAASITFVAVENIVSSKLHSWRPMVVFGFGLLHGLGFASVLVEWGLPQGGFVPALIGFNVGVELGQLTVIAAAFAAVGYWFGRTPWYRSLIAIPASAAIAVIGAWWFFQRVFL